MNANLLPCVPPAEPILSCANGAAGRTPGSTFPETASR